jgi:hypothetical protein
MRPCERQLRLLLAADGTTLSNVLNGTQRVVELEEKALEARKRTLGEKHPGTLLSIYNLEFYLTSLTKQTQPCHRAEKEIVRNTKKYLQ